MTDERQDSILIIDDDEQVSDILSLVLESQGYEIRSCLTPEKAIQELRSRGFSLILLDLRLGEDSGLDLLPRIREMSPNTPVFMITAHGDVDSAVKAFTLGANGYIKKPFQEGDLKLQISQAIENYRLRTEVDSLKGQLEVHSVRDIIRTRDPVMEALIRRVESAALVPSNVVITGESGTGKELVARALHKCGPRRTGPFIAFNCAALPETLLESELFGHARGAFTDAKETKPGLFQRANGGTLFLDEIGDAPLSIQTKLLRVLQEREVLPVGAITPVKIDVRVIAATHKCLQTEVAEGRFRKDLYYRLHVLPIAIPPLRARPKDILLLASYFADRLGNEMGRPFRGFTPTAQATLESHAWPGNVRELQNRVEHAIAISNGGMLSAQSLFPECEIEEEIDTQAGDDDQLNENVVPDALPTFFEAKNQFERSYLEQVLALAKGNIAKASRLASKSRTEVYSLLRKHDLDPAAFKQEGT